MIKELCSSILHDCKWVNGASHGSKDLCESTETGCCIGEIEGEKKFNVALDMAKDFPNNVR